MPDTVEAPIFWTGGDDTEGMQEHIRKVAIVVNEILAGKSNNVFDVTLTPNATETVVTRERTSMDSRVSLTPKSATAAAAIGAGAVWVETTVNRITIHHDSQPDADRTFGATVVG